MDCNEKFTELAKRKFSESFRECSEFLRHKTTLIEPTTLIKHGVKLHKIVQKPREFVIARAAAYHAGFNSGFNIAEAVNFAMPSWLDIADNVSYCKCAKDSVRIDMNLFRKRLRGEPISIEDAKPQPEIKRSMCAAKSMAPKAEVKKAEVKKAEPKKKRDEKAQRKQDKKVDTVVKVAAPERKEGESSVGPIANVEMIVTTKKVKAKAPAPAKVEKPKPKSVEKKSPPKKAPAPQKPVTIKKPEPQPKAETLVPKKRVRPSRAKVRETDKPVR